jgi:hypothetical protein
MILNRNPFELAIGLVALAFAMRFGWWMFRQLVKDDPNMPKFKED